MLFNSFTFVLFFIALYTSYILLRNHYKLQNRLLLVGSYFFYGFWDWRFTSLLALSTVVDFTVGRLLHSTEDKNRRKLLLGISIISNLAVLGSFKYFNFFADSLTELLGTFGLQADFVTLRIILPVGISFYTFQTLSYSFDIYRRKLEPTSNFLDFALFVSFFPQLVAGPIERASNLLPQFTSKRHITPEQVNAGIYLILWGFFKKVVIADNLGVVADDVFNGYNEKQGLDLLLGMLAFAFQIYGDFSGYSDIARGVSKLMGFELMVNFKLPYFARNPSDFWLRWHVSLSSWLRDYLYVSLGGNRNGRLNTYRNLALTMLLGGLWHGAAWNFVVWGGFHGLILIVYRVFEEKRILAGSWGPMGDRVKVLGQIAIMFVLTLIGWVIFRSTSVEQIFVMISGIGLEFSEDTLKYGYRLVLFVTPLVLVQLYQQASKDLLVLTKLKVAYRIPIYSFLFMGILILGVRKSSEFIYFQF